jgi:DNA-directed RNA polymerase sigma subunit (sigma70/sigma32)
MEDIDLIKSIKKDACSPCIQELREKHAGLIISIYSKYLSVLETVNFSPSDFNDEINYIIYSAARKYDLRRRTKMKFSTYLGESVRFFCLNKINELKKNKTVETEPETLTFLIDDYYKNTHLDKSKNADSKDYIFDILGQLKDKRIKKIFKYRYFTGNKLKLPWYVIGEKVGLTAQSCINIHNKTINFLKKKLTSLETQDKI